MSIFLAAALQNDLSSRCILQTRNVKKLTAFRQVATSAAKVAELVGEIAAASREQAQGISIINKAVAEMDKVTQQNAGTDHSIRRR